MVYLQKGRDMYYSNDAKLKSIRMIKLSLLRAMGMIVLFRLEEEQKETLRRCKKAYGDLFGKVPEVKRCSDNLVLFEMEDYHLDLTYYKLRGTEDFNIGDF